MLNLCSAHKRPAFFSPHFMCECLAQALIKVNVRPLFSAGREVFISSSLILIRPSQHRSQEKTWYHLCFRTPLQPFIFLLRVPLLTLKAWKEKMPAVSKLKISSAILDCWKWALDAEMYVNIPCSVPRDLDAGSRKAWCDLMSVRSRCLTLIR